MREIEQTLRDARQEADDRKIYNEVILNGRQPVTRADALAISRRTYREMTRDARARNWDIFSTKWEYFLKFPALPLQCLCALSSGIHPYFADPTWLFSMRCHISMVLGEMRATVQSHRKKRTSVTRKSTKLRSFLWKDYLLHRDTCLHVASLQSCMLIPKVH